MIEEVLAVGPTGVDIVQFVGVPGETFRELGGGCRNISIGLAHLGARVIFATQRYEAPPDVSRATAPNMSEVQLTERLWLARFIAKVDGINLEATAEYEEAASLFDRALGRNARQIAPNARIVVSCSDVSYECWNELSQSASSEGAVTCLVTSGEPVPRDYVRWWNTARWLFLNEREAELCGLSPRTAIESALAAGVKFVAVTCGERGVIVGAAQESITVVPSKPVVDVQSPIGAGDAFTAGVIFAKLRNTRNLDAVALGQECARAVLRSRSNTLPSRSVRG